MAAIMADAKNWHLVQSDPKVFSGLIRGLGVRGVQVEDLWSLDCEQLKHLKQIGIFFLSKSMPNEENVGTVVQDSRLDKIFFAKQVINNACATQAIISILLNSKHPNLHLGTTLKYFKEFTQPFDGNMKGLALSNSDTIRGVNNSFARLKSSESDPKSSAKDGDIYHFVGYVPVDGRLYELDGLKEGPIDLGVIPSDSDWTNVVGPIIEKRIQGYSEGELLSNLMAIVPCKDEDAGMMTIVPSKDEDAGEVLTYTLPKIPFEMANHISNRGRRLAKLRAETGARIYMCPDQAGSLYQTCKITGSRGDVMRAAHLIQEIRLAEEERKKCTRKRKGSSSPSNTDEKRRKVLDVYVGCSMESIPIIDGPLTLLADLDGKFMKLFNAGESCELGGFKIIQNDFNFPMTFVFPAGAVIDEGDEVTVWSAGQDLDGDSPNDYIMEETEEKPGRWLSGLPHFELTLLNRRKEVIFRKEVILGLGRGTESWTPSLVWETTVCGLSLLRDRIQSTFANLGRFIGIKVSTNLT